MQGYHTSIWQESVALRDFDPAYAFCPTESAYAQAMLETQDAAAGNSSGCAGGSARI